MRCLCFHIIYVNFNGSSSSSINISIGICRSSSSRGKNSSSNSNSSSTTTITTTTYHPWSFTSKTHTTRRPHTRNQIPILPNTHTSHLPLPLLPSFPSPHRTHLAKWSSVAAVGRRRTTHSFETFRKSLRKGRKIIDVLVLYNLNDCCDNYCCDNCCCDSIVVILVWLIA